MKIKTGTIFLFFLTMSFCIANKGYSQENTKKTKKDFKQSVFLTGDFVNASLETTISFESKSGLLTANIGLEQNLGLVKSKIFFTGSALWRITYRSGIFGSYYGIHRSKVYTVNQDIPYLDKFIPKGTEVKVYFNTNVTSLGYMFTIVNDTKSYLGGFINFFLMSIKTGVSAQGLTLQENVSFFAPLPNFGVVTIFKVTNWLELSSKFGIFYLRLDEFSGKINDFNIGAQFKINKWLGVNLAYKVFDVSILFYTHDIKTVADYNFRGPALGVSLNF